MDNVIHNTKIFLFSLYFISAFLFTIIANAAFAYGNLDEDGKRRADSILLNATNMMAIGIGLWLFLSTFE